MPLKSRRPDGGRHQVLEYLYKEIIGPNNDIGTPISIESLPLRFNSIPESLGPWKDELTGQEILSGIRPKQRYGAGILTPESNALREIDDPELEVPDQDMDDAATQADASQSEAEEDEEGGVLIEEVEEENGAQDPKTIRLPSSMGFSCFVDAQQDSELTFTVKGGWYQSIQVEVQGRKFVDETWYVRREFRKSCKLSGKRLTGIKYAEQLTLELENETECHLNIDLIAFVRPWGENRYLITFTAVNRTEDDSASSKSLLFQTELNLKCLNSQILAYPKDEISVQDVEDEIYREKSLIDDESTELLFRNYPTFGIGHNCAVDWESELDRVVEISADSFPVFEGPSITPEISFEGGDIPNLKMFTFAQESNRNSVIEEMSRIADQYSLWIEKESKKFKELDNQKKYANAFNSNRDECVSALQRIRKGIEILKTNEEAYTAFRLMNEAILMQQIRSRLPIRKTFVDDEGRIAVSGRIVPVVLDDSLVNSWRPFQIAFILSVLESLVDEECENRDLVDLIFFPTGGGKTEAYLGVIAFTILYRRLINSKDDGTVVLMRYTLRLLTTQQFLRAAALICSLEKLRRQDPLKLGEHQISIGAWLGGDVTPNTRQQALDKLEKLNAKQRRRLVKAENPFLVLQCPWCAAKFGQVMHQDVKNLTRKASGYRQGYLGSKRTVLFACPDENCEYNSGLPLYVVDEDIYEQRPSLVIGTVDKFAMLAWKPAAQKLFARNDGELIPGAKPPSLIIQDEFHLISGPLGSMVGHYETVIEELCSVKENGKTIKPKIVSSTATIRRFWAQANAIYGRDKVSLFPPPLLDISDSFFAVWDREKGGSNVLKPGRLYVGIFAPGLGSIRSSQVRVGAALTLAPMILDDERRDAWWTNLWFFNSLKELFNTISLFQNDIPRYLTQLTRRDKLSPRYLRRPPMELTSRKENSEIPETLEKLQQPYDPANLNNVIDVCLASNIIEVGVDIDRLSLMTVVSQPKSTAQYIQVTGRVGRKPPESERPGLVAILYALGRPRDLSHFEHFRSYHERMYAQVEPTSVTPFALPVIKRGLRGAVTSFLRMNMKENSGPIDVPDELLNKTIELFRDRVTKIAGVSAEERNALSEELETIKKELARWGKVQWDDGSTGLLVRQGLDQDIPPLTWRIPMSMRNVDAGTAFNITTKYNAI